MMEKLKMIESTSEWLSTGITRHTILTEHGEGKIQVDLLNRDDSKYGRTAFVWDLYVHPDYRRKGIAKQLMQRALEVAKEQGFATATLVWTLLDSKREIARWYASLGFVEKELSHTYALMVKNIS